jgi:hypothetical protein
MNVQAFADFVETMIVQHDYPGFEPRSLKLGLPDVLNKAGSKMFAEALAHDSVFV